MIEPRDTPFELGAMICIVIVILALIVWVFLYPSRLQAQEWALTSSGFAVTITSPIQEDMEPCLATVPGAQGFPPRMCPKAKVFEVQWAWS